VKNDFRKQVGRLAENRFFRALNAALQKLWRLVSGNLGLKLLSLLLAVLMWNYVVSSNSSITRNKTLTGLTGYLSGQSSLASYGKLALLDYPSEELNNISVTVEVPQSEYANVSADNVQVTLDLSRVRTAGTQEVALKATTSYGRVVRIIPETLPLTFEAQDSRTIPVNVQLGGDEETGRWYNVSRRNPASLTISGAASVVQSIASASVYIDVADAEKSFTAAERFVLLDSAGNEIPQAMLSSSSSSISVSVDVYPTKEIPIATEIAKVITGQPAEGYEVVGVSIQPQSLVVAADQDLLDSITELNISPISVEGLSQGFAARASVSALSSFKSVSAEQVYVYVTIAEETIGAWIEGVKVSYVNKSEGLTLQERTEEIRVYVTGPRSDVELLQESGFVVTADLSGLGAGSWEAALDLPLETYPDVDFTPEVSEVAVVLAEAGA